MVWFRCVFLTIFMSLVKVVRNVSQLRGRSRKEQRAADWWNDEMLQLLDVLHGGLQTNSC